MRDAGAPATHGCARVTPAGPRRRVWLLVLVLGAVAVVVQGRQYRERHPPTKLTFLPNDKIRLEGHARILVGDSLCILWPGEAHDVVAFSGTPVGAVVHYAGGYLAAGAHEEVVLWAGTAHYSTGSPPAAFREDFPQLVEAVGDRPHVILGPLPPHGLAEDKQAAYAEINAFLAATYPDVYLDPAAILGLPERAAEFHADSIHLNAAGYAVLIPVVDAQLARAGAR